MDDQKLALEIKNIVSNFLEGLNYKKIVIRLKRDEFSCSLVDAVQLDGEYKSIVSAARIIGKNMQQCFKLAGEIRGIYGDFYTNKNTVYIIENDDISELESEVFSFDDDYRDRIMWSYKYLGIENTMLTEEDKKIGQQIL